MFIELIDYYNTNIARDSNNKIIMEFKVYTVLLPCQFCNEIISHFQFQPIKKCAFI